MNFFRKKKKKKLSSVLYHPKTIAFMGFVIISVISVPLWKKIDEKQRLDFELSNLKNEIERLSMDNSDLDQLIEYLKSDYFVEEQARLNLGLKKRGEEVFVIKNNNQENINNSSGSSGIVGLGTNIHNSDELNTDRWLNYFFGK
jgi:cell division protein FtsB